jgi:predicted Co/Zn/Cd cation transporter (cation efflux family)
LKVSSLVRRRSDRKFHFGYAAFSPLINTVKALTLLLICGFALASSLGALFDGGRPLNARIAIVYAVIAATACFAVAIVQRHAAGKVHSELLPLEFKSWFIDGWMSLLVGVAFVVAYALEGSRWAHLVPYIDPALVVLLVSVVVFVPLRTVRDSVGELMAVAPPEPLQQEVRRRFDEATRDEAFDKTFLRMMKVGRYLYVLIQIVVADRFSVAGVSDLDRIRGRVRNALHDVHPNLEIDTLFTADERWVE